MHKKHNIFCSTRLFVTWFSISLVACVVYAVIVFVSLVNKDVVSSDDGPLFIPYTNVPQKYDVRLQFDTDHDRSNTTYSGEVSISFLAREQSQRFFIHQANDMKMDNIRLTRDDENIFVRKGNFNKQTGIQTLILSNNMTADADYLLTFSFKHYLASSGPGPVEYSYDLNGKRYGISFISKRTASLGLRFLFPCLDARDFPALFNFEVRRKSSLRFVSNHIVTDSQLDSPYVIDEMPAKTRFYPHQIALALTDFPSDVEQFGNMTISAYYRPSVLDGISIRRLRQFMDKSSSTIGKVDAVVLSHSETIHHPGFSILNEEETFTENREIALVMGQNATI